MPPRRTAARSLLVIVTLAACLTPPPRAAGQSTGTKPDKVDKATGKGKSILDRVKATKDALKEAAKGKGGVDSTTSGRAAPSAPPVATPSPSSAPPRTPSAASAAPAGSGASAPPSTAVQRGSARIEELVVAPNENGITYAVTDRGGHFAAVVPKGSRFAVMYDGVVGPAFDRIVPVVNGRTFAFSPDGARFGYLGETGGEYTFMVDGKPALKIPVGPPSGTTPRLVFSANGRHWLVHYPNPSGGANDPTPSRTWWDGVAGPILAQSDFTLSPDGERHAYSVLSTTTGGHVLVVDGKPMPTLGGNPVFTADGKHLFTTRYPPGRQGSRMTELLLDGRPIARAENVAVHVPPVGDRVVVVVGRGDAQGGYDKYALIVGGKLLPGSETTGYPYVLFSPDGQRFAAVAGGRGARQRVSIDGTLGRTYDRIDSLWFTPDSKHAVYLGVSSTKRFVVVDSTESEVGFALNDPLVPSFTNDGRVGWLASTGQRNAVVVDGKVTPLDPRLWSGAFSFSPDGKRFAYAVARDASAQLGGTVHIDHTPGPPSTMRDFEQLRAGDPIKYLWSPDSRYTVNYGYPGTNYGTDFGFIVGDRYLPVGNFPRVALPTFTPDGKHFFWLGYNGQTQDRQIWLDGRVVYEFDQQGEQPLKTTGGWLMGEDGTLTFFIQTADGFKRVRVTPGPENGFEAWLAKGRALR